MLVRMYCQSYLNPIYEFENFNQTTKEWRAQIIKDSSTYCRLFQGVSRSHSISSRVKKGPLSFTLHMHQMLFISLSSKYEGTLIHLQNIIMYSQNQLKFSCDGKTRKCWRVYICCATCSWSKQNVNVGIWKPNSSICCKWYLLNRLKRVCYIHVCFICESFNSLSYN